MEERHKAILRAKRLEISSDLRFGDIRRRLLNSGILNGENLDEIENQQTRGDQVKALLDILSTKGPNAFSVFRYALNDSGYPHLARILKDESQQGPTREPRVFIIHAGEDKDSFVRPLVTTLQQQGLAEKDIFFDDVSIKPGEVIRDRIISTLSSESLELAVVVVSTSFLKKPYWPRLEFETCLKNNKSIFPIWVDANDDSFKAFSELVGKYSPTLKQMSARRVQRDHVTDELTNIAAEVVQRLSTLESSTPQPSDMEMKSPVVNIPTVSEQRAEVRQLLKESPEMDIPTALVSEQRAEVRQPLKESPEMGIPTASELRAEVRQLLKKRSEDFNVLVVGRAGACKSTLINSMNMALAEKWSELASFGQGGTQYTTLRLDKIPMFEDQFMKEKVENYDKKVYFWDCAAMQNYFHEAYGEFIGLTLDGRVPDKTSLFAVVRKGDNQMVSVKDLREKFPTVTEGNRFNRVLFLCACDEVPPEKLLELVMKTTSPHYSEGRCIPVFLALLKQEGQSQGKPALVQ